MTATLNVQKVTQEGTAKALTGERLLIRLIDAGQGSSGYYPAETLEAAASEGVFPAGTHMYIDHPGEAESMDRPERTLRDLAAVLAEDAYYDAESQALVAEATVFKPYREVIHEMKDHIGVSIRSWAEYDGNVVVRLIESLSVDFVTHAGRGGKVIQVLESRKTAREGLDSVFHDQLNKSVAAIWEQSYVRDYDKDAGLVYIYSWNDEKYYEASFEVSGDDVNVSGERYEVYPETRYKRVGANAESEEIEVADAKEVAAEAQAAVEARVTALESQITALQAENEQLKAEKAAAVKESNESKGEEILTRVLGESELPEISQTRIRESAEIGDDFDAVKFEDMLNAEIKRESDYVSAITGASKVSGFGKESAGTSTTIKTAWGRQITN